MDLFPVVVATWPFGLPAGQIAWDILSAGDTALNAIEAGIASCEDDASVESVGYGGLPDASGEVTLDASIMDHRGNCGAVACLKRVRNAIQVARKVMEQTPHVLLVGEGATQFALSNGFVETNLLSESAADRHTQWKFNRTETEESHDTLGMLAIDAKGVIAGGCSTSGTAFKLPGRVGDSPMIGAGLYVDAGVGAASATGIGEEAIKVCGSYAVVENMRRGMGPRDAIADVLRRVLLRRNNIEIDLSFIALRTDGLAAGLTLRKQKKFQYALITSASAELIDAESVQ